MGGVIDFIKNEDKVIYPVTILDAIYDDNGKQLSDILNGYQPKGSYSLSSHNHDTVYAKLNHSHSNYSLTTHNHDSIYAKVSHTHDDRYYTESEVNTKLNSKANTNHSHSYLPLSGGDMTGHILFAGLGSGRQIVNVASLGQNTQNITGAICICFPWAFQCSMQTHEITIYNYNGHTTINLIVSFYDYDSPNGFYNETATCDNIDIYSVGLGLRKSDNHVCIFIGDSNRKWIYPQVHVKHSLFGYYGKSGNCTPEILFLKDYSGFEIHKSIRCNLRSPFIKAVSDGSYYGVELPNADGSYLRAPKSGYLPYAPNDGYCGTPGYNFYAMCANYFYNRKQLAHLMAKQSTAPSTGEVFWGW